MKKEKVDILSDLINYHENVFAYAEEIKKIHKSFSEGSVPKAWRNFYNFYNTDIIQHFEFEEKVVFPAIVGGKKSIAVKEFISNLLFEHIDIKQDGAKLLKLYTANRETISQDAIPIIEDSLIKFGNYCTTHAVKENNKLLPIVETNKRVRFLMGRAFLEFRNVYKHRFDVF